MAHRRQGDVLSIIFENTQSGKSGNLVKMISAQEKFLFASKTSLATFPSHLHLKNER